MIVISFAMSFYAQVMLIIHFNERTYWIISGIIYALSWGVLFLGIFLAGGKYAERIMQHFSIKYYWNKLKSNKK